MNTYTKLKLHLERHMYKRGAFKGDAPADSGKRYKSHFRVMAADDRMIVRMYNTDILTAYEDGTIRINTGGWFTSTTLRNLNSALGTFFTGPRMWVGSRRVFGMSQPTIMQSRGTVMFYDGIMFDAEGNQRGTPLPFERKRADREERADFRKDLAESGFKDAFPILYQTAEMPATRWLNASMEKLVRDSVHVNQWSHVAGLLKYPTYYHQSRNKPCYEDWRDAWKSLMAQCTKYMTEVVRTDVLVINP